MCYLALNVIEYLYYSNHCSLLTWKDGTPVHFLGHIFRLLFKYGKSSHKIRVCGACLVLAIIRWFVTRLLSEDVFGFSQGN